MLNTTKPQSPTKEIKIVMYQHVSENSKRQQAWNNYEINKQFINFKKTF